MYSFKQKRFSTDSILEQNYDNAFPASGVPMNLPQEMDFQDFMKDYLISSF